MLLNVANEPQAKSLAFIRGSLFTAAAFALTRFPPFQYTPRHPMNKSQVI